MNIKGNMNPQKLLGKVKTIRQTDRSLMKSGYAADAKVTGEALEARVKKVDIVNDLETEDSNKPLSAMQGVALKELIDALDTRIGVIEKQSNI